MKKTRLSKSERQEWLLIIRKLKEALPLGEKVEVRTLPIKTLSGYCTKSSDGWSIVISSYLDFNGRIDALEHEYAHALDDNPDRGNFHKEHGASWGIKFSKCHRVVRDLL